MRSCDQTTLLCYRSWKNLDYLTSQHRCCFKKKRRSKEFRTKRSKDWLSKKPLKTLVSILLNLTTNYQKEKLLGQQTFPLTNRSETSLDHQMLLSFYKALRLKRLERMWLLISEVTIFITLLLLVKPSLEIKTNWMVLAWELLPNLLIVLIIKLLRYLKDYSQQTN